MTRFAIIRTSERAYVVDCDASGNVGRLRPTGIA